jgi:hypothetical protein
VCARCVEQQQQKQGAAKGRRDYKPDWRRNHARPPALTLKHDTDSPHLATRVRTGSTHNSTNFRLAILPTDAAATATTVGSSYVSGLGSDGYSQPAAHVDTLYRTAIAQISPFLCATDATAYTTDAVRVQLLSSVATDATATTASATTIDAAAASAPAAIDATTTDTATVHATS